MAEYHREYGQSSNEKFRENRAIQKTERQKERKMPLIETCASTQESFSAYLAQQCGYLDVRILDNGLYSAIMPLMFTHAIITGRVGDYNSYEDRWCYGGLEKARSAHDLWDGTGEPEGWHRHPATGRRREIDEETSLILGEYVNF